MVSADFKLSGVWVDDSGIWCRKSCHNYGEKYIIVIVQLLRNQVANFHV